METFEADGCSRFPCGVDPFEPLEVDWCHLLTPFIGRRHAPFGALVGETRWDVPGIGEFAAVEDVGRGKSSGAVLGQSPGQFRQVKDDHGGGLDW
ncbi:hypothetical protein ABZX69_13585 [Streptomyces sp. NPDC004074]|uniref:hypothetical protein n=1 Tax=Streptomyces sp. NPDC004074 TaxID=3154277 RepID=UPI00339E46CC